MSKRLQSFRRILGIDAINKCMMIESIVSLFAIGFVSSCLYDLWRLLPTVLRFWGTGKPDWENLFLCLVPVALTFVWFFYLYFKYKDIFQPVKFSKTNDDIKPHKGVVTALSIPRLSVDDINDQINNTGFEDIHKLYTIIGIGQIFRGLFRHKTELRFVWAIVTKKSEAYVVCIETFLKKFIPQARLMKKSKGGPSYIIDEKTDQEQIKNVKSLLKKIYSDDLESSDLLKQDIIVDITGGTKPITIGLIFGALDSTIDIQYTEQSEENNVIPLKIDHRIILDKTGEFLIEMYQQMDQEISQPESDKT